MKIGLDYDGTITSDPEGFYAFAKMMRARGHEVYIVTMRYPSECVSIPTMWSFVVNGIYPTSRQPKKAHMLSRGINIDVWVDDEPRAIYQDASQIWEQASPEGVVVIPNYE